jgi:hypothetical protein
MALDYGQLRVLALRHIKGADADVMAAIAMAESKGVKTAVGGPNTNGTRDYGLWQINEKWREWDTSGFIRAANLLNTEANAKAAGIVFKAQGYKAWSTFNSGAYKKFLSTDPGVVKRVTDLFTDIPVVDTFGDAMGKVKGVADIPGMVTAGVKALGESMLNSTLTAGGFIAAIVMVVLGVVILARRPAMAVVKTATTAVTKGV